MIHFNLKNINEVLPFGEYPHLTINWFALTDADLWLTFGNNILYEYTHEAHKFFKNKPTIYNDYYLSRFIEDFCDLFQQIGVSLPEEFYILTKDIKCFLDNSQEWIELSDTEEHYAEYENLVSWIYERQLNSNHLKGGPKIYFFRYNDLIRIVWKTEYKLENGSDLWTAKSNWYEMKYSDFVSEVRKFITIFFNEMDIQVENAILKDWRNVYIDKSTLLDEHILRKNSFFKAITFLEKANNKIETYWDEKEKIYRKMLKEI